MKTLVTGGAGAASATKQSGLAYKIGLGVIATGIVIAASSWLIGGVVFVALTALLTLLGAPEHREILPPSEPAAGGQLLQFFGVTLIVCGVYVISLRFVIELLGLADKTEFTGKLSRADKLGLGATAIGFLVGVSSGLSQGILNEIFLYEYGSARAVSILETVGYVGSAVLLCGLAVLLLGGPSRQRVLLDWTNKVGWGKLGYAWINKLGLGLILVAIIGGTLGLEDPASIVVGAGLAILVVGLVPHLLAGWRP